MSKMIKFRTITAGSLALLLVLFFALTMISNAALKGYRLDLTENNLYTLSDGTRNLLQAIDEPINLYYFFSEQTSRELPSLRTYANRVRETLDEFVMTANGKIKLHVIDPLPFSEHEDRAAQFGLQAIPIGAGGESLYFGLAGTNSVDGVETVDFFQPDKEAFLEYDLAKLVHSLAHPKKPVIAILSSLPLNGGFDPMTQRPSQPWIIADQIKQLFDVRTLHGDIAAIDDDVDVLLLAHPKDLSDKTLYAIDQYVLKGGNAMVFVDPHAEAEQPVGGNPMATMGAPRSSQLDKLFATWGIAFDSEQVLLDARHALAVNMQPDQAPIRHYGIIGFDQTALAHDDVATAQLSNVNVSMTGYIKPLEAGDHETTLLPLLTSSDQAMPTAAEKVRLLTDPNMLQQDFAATGEQYIIAARLQGKVKTAFPEGAPQQAQEADETATASEETDDSKKVDHLAESTGPINVIVVADSDILSDRLWVSMTEFFGQRIATAWANNGDFVINALDNLTGNADLISIRGQAVSSRPFTTVEELKRIADSQFRATEQRLQEQLEETERKLAELQSSRGEEDNALILSDAQRAEIEDFLQKKLEIRKQLRQVRHDLDREIDTLGTQVKFANIGLMPILVGLFALAWGWWRHRQRAFKMQQIATD